MEMLLLLASNNSRPDTFRQLPSNWFISLSQIWLSKLCGHTCLMSTFARTGAGFDKYDIERDIIISQTYYYRVVITWRLRNHSHMITQHSTSCLIMWTKDGAAFLKFLLSHCFPFDYVMNILPSTPKFNNLWYKAIKQQPQDHENKNSWNSVGLLAFFLLWKFY